MVVKYSFFSATRFLLWDKFALVVVLDNTGLAQWERLYLTIGAVFVNLSNVLHHLQLLLGASGSGARAGRSNRRSGRSAGGGADGRNG